MKNEYKWRLKKYFHSKLHVNEFVEDVSSKYLVAIE